MEKSIVENGRSIARRLAAILRKDVIRLCVVDGMPGLAEGWRLHHLSRQDRFADGRVTLSDDLFSADIVLLWTSGANLQGLRRYLEKRGFQGILCAWLSDNHIAPAENRIAVRESDFHFGAHHGFEFLSPSSIAGPVLPACPRGIPLDPLLALSAACADLPRLSFVVAPYVIYDKAPRTPFLQALQRYCPEYCCLFTAAHERPPGRNMLPVSDGEWAMRWLAFKSSLCVPMNRDLSIRAFDGLLAGHVLLVPEDNPAFDLVIPPQEQDALDIVRFPMPGDLEITGDREAMRALARQAVARFDAAGREGVARRQDFILRRHTLDHRLEALLAFFADFLEARVVTDLVVDGEEAGLRAFYADGGWLGRRPMAAQDISLTQDS